MGETKRVAKRKIITFLKKKGVSESKIIEAYSAYYKEEGLYEITFNQRPLGFSVIMDTRGKNAIVSSVQDDTNQKLGMKVASRVYEINGKRVDDLKHKDILKLMAQQPTPFYVVFKESRKKSSKLEKKKKKIEAGLKWQEDDQLKQKEKEDENKNVNEEEEEYSSDSTISSYDSDDDEAHVAHHYSRKTQSMAYKKKKKKLDDNKQGKLFKPHEIDQWDDGRIEDEQAAMLKQLSMLMMGAVASADMAASSSTTNIKIDGMTHKRQNTLKTLLDVTSSPNDNTKKHEIQKSLSNARKFSVTELTSMDEEEEYDPEIFKYLSELVGDQKQAPPLTPSTSKIMKDLFMDTVDEPDEIILNLPEFGGPDGAQNGSMHNVQYSDMSNLSSVGSDHKDDEEEDVIESLEQGTTLLKYGKYGKPKYKMFHLTPDHKYLVWFSQKKSSEETRIKIKEIRKIAIGSESKVVEKTKKTDLHETSFTIFYGKSNNQKNWKSLTVTAKNDKEAFVWAQGLKILSDASKQGKHLRTLSKKQMPTTANIEHDDQNEDIIKRGHHKKQSSVIISIDKLQKQSVLNLFSKSSQATVTSLLKQHSKHKVQLQKCVDFVMTKANYRAIANAGQFDKVKLKLEDLDNRLREIKSKLTASNETQEQSDLSSVKAELFSCAADLDALKQKLTAIVRRPQKL